MKKKSIIILAVTLAILLILAIVLPLVLLLPKKKSPSSEMISMAKAKEYMVNGLKTEDDPENRNVFKVLGQNIKMQTTVDVDAEWEDGDNVYNEKDNIAGCFIVDKSIFDLDYSQLQKVHDSPYQYLGQEIKLQFGGLRLTPDENSLQEETSFIVNNTVYDYSKDAERNVTKDKMLGDEEDAAGAAHVLIYYSGLVGDTGGEFGYKDNNLALKNVIPTLFLDETFETNYQEKILKTNFKNGFSLTFDVWASKLNLLEENEEDYIYYTFNVNFVKNKITSFDISLSSTYFFTDMIDTDFSRIPFFNHNLTFSALEINETTDSQDWYVFPDWFNPKDWEETETSEDYL